MHLIFIYMRRQSGIVQKSQDDKYPNIPETGWLPTWVPCVMLHLYTDDGRMANIQIAILCIMPLQDLNVNFVANNNKCLFSWNSAQ